MTRLTAGECNSLKHQIDVADRAIASVRVKLRRDEVNNCSHEWRDESYINGHNGNEEASFVCSKCGWSIGHKPRKTEHY